MSGPKAYVIEKVIKSQGHGGVYHEDGDCWTLTRSDSIQNIVPLDQSVVELEQDDAWRACGHCSDPEGGVNKQWYSDDELLDEITRLAEETGRSPPRKRDVDELGRMASKTIIDRFGSWNRAVEAAGFFPRQQGE